MSLEEERAYRIYNTKLINLLDDRVEKIEKLIKEEGIEGPSGGTGSQGPQGPKGEDGKSAYEIYCENTSNPLSQADWLASLKGPKGDTGPQGPKGQDGDGDIDTSQFATKDDLKSYVPNNSEGEIKLKAFPVVLECGGNTVEVYDDFAFLNCPISIGNQEIYGDNDSLRIRATKVEVDSPTTKVSGSLVNDEDKEYATKEYVDQHSGGGTIDISQFATKTELEDLITTADL
ncbi:hypothetical protein TRFO_38156 [Tritrichomonas foetus]|uniref:Collagen-like protein n=1 Tax=Tritrichomonas foetus TaxID=1144522 RepID=A0A1J4JDD0_9EUKA|nr:hypothetical protein TRFO_38156 [Tritrichomonas foetus]|eukprot:OHS95683.1 hypothetical protein TRFO_38156 [Tritrichomonas foetus]